MKRIFLILMPALLLLLAACSTTRVVDREPADGFSLSSYKTFNFYEVSASGDSTVPDAAYRQGVTMLQREIARQLTLHGLHQAANPDLEVNIGLVLQEKVQTRQTDIREAPRYVGQRRYSWKSEEIEVGRYKEGTATIHLVDRAQNKMVWRGVVEDVVSPKASRREAQVTAAVAELFKDIR
ncbi:DUF4136 domain-containing protein [Chitinophaga horti]|uniref:DUF4136 domain-containing protein n=1 Tax=Chitinophaga horti TaxID=2920382 RepID=A0ABY6J2W4_9BACT|nr:DUF4136 domain-containing protein [Chitinophaga horti]UYQ92507.1 DUF4136 domain-containing protein [Chitinophaga horti]